MDSKRSRSLQRQIRTGRLKVAQRARRGSCESRKALRTRPTLIAPFPAITRLRQTAPNDADLIVRSERLIAPAIFEISLRTASAFVAVSRLAFVRRRSGRACGHLMAGLVLFRLLVLRFHRFRVFLPRGDLRVRFRLFWMGFFELIHLQLLWPLEPIYIGKAVIKRSADRVLF